MTSSNPHPVDIHVGRRLRLRRNVLGLSQEQLGDSVGVTFQQIQKYERGANRVGSSRLFDLSKILKVPVSFFFEQFADEIGSTMAAGFAEEPTPFEHDYSVQDKETANVIKAYYNISDPAVRKKMLSLMQTMANSE